MLSDDFEKRLSEARLFTQVEQVGEALDAYHAAGLIAPSRKELMEGVDLLLREGRTHEAVWFSIHLLTGTIKYRNEQMEGFAEWFGEVVERIKAGEKVGDEAADAENRKHWFIGDLFFAIEERFQPARDPYYHPELGLLFSLLYRLADHGIVDIGVDNDEYDNIVVRHGGDADAVPGDIPDAAQEEIDELSWERLSSVLDDLRRRAEECGVENVMEVWDFAGKDKTPSGEGTIAADSLIWALAKAQGPGPIWSDGIDKSLVSVDGMSPLYVRSMVCMAQTRMAANDVAGAFDYYDKAIDRHTSRKAFQVFAEILKSEAKRLLPKNESDMPVRKAIDEESQIYAAQLFASSGLRAVVEETIMKAIDRLGDKTGTRRHSLKSLIEVGESAYVVVANILFCCFATS